MIGHRVLTGSFAGLRAVDWHGFPIKVRPAARASGSHERYYRRQPPVLEAQTLNRLMRDVDDAQAGLGSGLVERSPEADADKVWLRLLSLAVLRAPTSGILSRELAWFDEPQGALGGATPLEAARDLPRYFALLARLVLNGGREPSAEDEALLEEQRSLRAVSAGDDLTARAFLSLAEACNYSPFLSSIYFTLLRLPGEGGETLFRLTSRGVPDRVEQALAEHFEAKLIPEPKAAPEPEGPAAVNAKAQRPRPRRTRKRRPKRK